MFIGKSSKQRPNAINSSCYLNVKRIEAEKNNKKELIKN